MNSTLADDIFSAYKRACLQDELDLAEILLKALEEIARKEGSDERLNHALLFAVDSRPRTKRKLN